jgi:hypothetical protein
VNAEDCYGRRRIHLAVALGVAESVQLLLNADCGLYTPPQDYSLLQHALVLECAQKQHILDMLVAALNDRHTRLLDMARTLLPCVTFPGISLVSGKKMESYAPEIMCLLLSHGIEIPEALELDGKGFYNLTELYGHMRLTPKIATALWNAGFRDIDEPIEYGLTPYLQSWYIADFDMVAWFEEKGVSPSSRHRDASLTALHLYARQLKYPSKFSN